MKSKLIIIYSLLFILYNNCVYFINLSTFYYLIITFYYSPSNLINFNLFSFGVIIYKHL